MTFPIALLATGLLTVILSLGGLTICNAYHTEQSGYDEGHNFIIEKAVEYIENKETSPAKDFPLRQFLPDLVYGSWYADHYDFGEGTDDCHWDYVVDSKTYRCDMIHHYGQVGEDLTVDVEFWGASWSTTKVGNTGEIAAPNYSKVLFDQAIKFWPDGEVPELSELPQKYAGYIQTWNPWPWGPDVTDLDYTWVGADPHSRLAGYPLWPPWAVIPNGIPAETESVAMKYLGWASHLMQDVTVPQNAANHANDESQEFESKMDEMIEKHEFDHLPVLAGTYYEDPSVSVFVPGDYIDMIAVTHEAMQQSIDLYETPAKHVKIMDMVIKMTARAIEMFFEEMAWAGGELNRGGISANPSHCWIEQQENPPSSANCNSNDGVACFEGPYGFDSFGCAYYSECEAMQYGYDGCVVIQSDQPPPTPEPACQVAPDDTFCGGGFPGPVWCGPEHECKFVSTCFAEAAGYDVGTDCIEI